MIRLQDFLAATGGQVHGRVHAQQFDDFAFDSRIVAPGQLFLAVVTETGDGHDFLSDACQAGATGIVCQHLPQQAPLEVTCILVENTQQALLDYARFILSMYSVEVVGITGSVGKTSAKEAIAAVLGTARSVFRNYGNYSGRFGLPVSLGRLTEDRDIAVLEMACDSYDEIRHLADITRPRIGVVTAIGHNHLEFFGTLDQIALEKGHLVEALPSDGTAVLNYDDPRVRAMAERAPGSVLTFGLDPGADLRAEEVTVHPDGTSLEVRWQKETIPLRIPLLGAHHAYTALTAAAVGLLYDLPWTDIARGLQEVSPLPGRTRLLAGVNSSHILDDSYSASPASSLAALETMKSLPARRRLFVLGDMTQLGSYTDEGHRIVGRRCAEVADRLFAKGELARIAADEAIRAGMSPSDVYVTYTAHDLVRSLAGNLREGDLVLLKGSAEARLELVARELLQDPRQAAQLLPRQHRGWARVRLERPARPTWVEIDLDAIAHNARQTVELVGAGAEVLAVLKADGYGHGALKVARTALNNGVTWLGVACLGEAVMLRRAGIDAPILLLGFTPAWQAREALLNEVVLTLFSHEVGAALSRAAVDLGRTARVHIKVDTGMGRLGLLPDEVLSFVRDISDLPGLEIDGIFTHFSAADDADLAYTYWQLERFESVLDELRNQGLLPPRIHAANSAAIFRVRASHYNLVRLGIAMYGLNASRDAPCPAGYRPALAFKCQIAQVKELPTGHCISYGRAFCTRRRSRIAVIPVGYADGFRRAPNHWGHVLVGGSRAPIVGRVCMDQTMIDVTDIPNVRQGDEVVLIGTQGTSRITVDEVARRLGTINYEVVSEILARVPRVV